MAEVPVPRSGSFWQSTTVRLIIIGIMVLLLLIPAALIKGLVREREERQDEANLEIGSKWGGIQTISGPVLAIPYREFIKTKDEMLEVNRYWYVLPDNLEIEGNVLPEIRYRGIYQTAVYNAKLNISGNFTKPDLTDLRIPDKDIFWDDAFIFVGIPDMRGIQNQVLIRWNNQDVPVKPGTRTKEVVTSGFCSDINIEHSELHAFSFMLDLNGSELINFIPLGEKTHVTLSSDWQHPSFEGSFLPDSREINQEGFSAEWQILHLNRNYPQQWTGQGYSVEESGFGVRLMIPVDHYQKTTRSVKYAIMFIALTFLVFFFSEVLNKYRIHPIQYLLVGLALSIFYVLLLSLSEHIGFNVAYLIASLSIIGLITAYAQTIFKKVWNTVIMAGCLLILYLFLYTLLQIQEYSLLLGSIGLFVVLAIVMYLSRNIDWYQPVGKGRSGKDKIGF